MTAPRDPSEDIGQLRRMRLVSLLEGTTLLVLVGIAVPLRHLGGVRVATTIMGPIHGMAFLLYIWMLIQTVASGCIPKRDVVRMIVAAFIPFGAFVNEWALRRAEAALTAAT
jgi:integral membrane protein